MTLKIIFMFRFKWLFFIYLLGIFNNKIVLALDEEWKARLHYDFDYYE